MNRSSLTGVLGVVVIVPLGLLLAACGISPPTRYYTLSEVMPSAAVSVASIAVATPSSANPPIRVEPVTIPPELDRLELVTRTGANQLHIAETDLWGAPLDEQIRRVLASDLADRLPQHATVDPNEPSTRESRRLLSVSIADFSAGSGCRVRLQADWTARDPEQHSHQRREPHRERAEREPLAPAHDERRREQTDP